MVARVREVLGETIYGVLGNHDTIRMVPDLERMGVTIFSMSASFEREGYQIGIAGIDDAHFYRVDNIEKAAAGIPDDAFSIPAVSYSRNLPTSSARGIRSPADGHTHGGQLCFSGRVPITFASNLPRAFGSGAWKYGNMAGYTSVGAGSCIAPVRFNLPPEITLHRLRRADKMT